MMGTSRTSARRILFVLLTGAIIFTATPQPAAAHPADMVNQTMTVVLTPDGIATHWQVFPGALLSYTFWDDADLNGDDAISHDETETWVIRQLDSFTLTLEEEPVKWDLVDASWPANFEAFQLGEERIEIDLAAGWPESATGAVSLVFDNLLQESISVNFYLVSADDGAAFSAPAQERGHLALTAYPDDVPADAVTSWDSGTPTRPEQGGLRVETGALQGTSTTARLTSLVSGDDLSFGFLVGAFVVALLLGAIHALTPGHGKTLVAAYLVGLHASVKHAIVLGSIVTLTHTGSVILLGLITLLASQVIVPTALFPILEIFSGLLIVGMGGALIARRLRGYRGVMRLRARQAAPEQAPPASPGRIEISVNESIATRPYDEILARKDGKAGISWRSLISLGVSGGLVPCPDAIALLLVSFTLRRLALGIGLVFTFSLGLAVVLIAIGILTVRSRKALEKFRLFDKASVALPLVSAVIVTALGLILTISAVSRTEFSVFFPQEQAAEFSLDLAHIIYTTGSDSEGKQVALMSLANGESVMLTAPGQTVRDTAISPDGGQLAYSLALEGGDSEIRVIDLNSGQETTLLTCPEAYCAGLIWAPDGANLLYERVNLFATDAIGSINTLWWLQALDGRSDPVFTDSGLPAYAASLSPDGQWLSYNTTQAREVRLYNLETGVNIALPVQLGTPILWAPDSRQFFVREMFVDDVNTTRTVLTRYRIEGDTVTLEDEAGIEGRTAVWAPDGEWIAVIRDIASETGAYQGNQVWVMQPDGSDARLLTEDDTVLHTTVIFSPDGQTLLCNQYELGVAASLSTLWLIDVATGEKTPLGVEGFEPDWAVVG